MTGAGSTLIDWISRWCEVLIGVLFAVHGTALLARGGGTGEWLLVLGAVAIAFSQLVIESPVATRIRAAALVLVTFALLIVTGGTASFFSLWLFVMLPVYAVRLRMPDSVVYAVVAAIAYPSLDLFVPSGVPGAVVWGRAGTFFLTTLIVAVVSERLATTSEHLRQSITERDRFVASVAHELRTPLTGVVGLSSVLSQHRDDLSEEDVEEFVSTIHRQGSELSAIVDDLLVVARAELDAVHVACQVVTATALIREVTGQLGPPDVIVDGDDRAVVFADPGRLRQIVRNLVTNALRHGGAQVHVRVEEQVDRTLIAVEDDGDGVPADVVANLFLPFSRGHGSGAPDSVGLGLYVSSHLSQLMGGSLAYTRAGGSTVFTVDLPSGR